MDNKAPCHWGNLPTTWVVIFYITVSGILSGCVSSSGLNPQGAILTPEQLPMARSLAQVGNEGDWPNSDWWVELDDPQLSALIAEALSNSPDLAAADAHARAAFAQSKAAAAQQYPTLETHAEVMGKHNSSKANADPGAGHFAWDQAANLNFSWGIDLWGTQRSTWLAALGLARVAQLEAQATRIQVSTNVARAYGQLAHAYAQLKIAQDEQQRAIQVMRLTQQRLNQGIDSDLARQQAETVVAGAQQQMLAAKRNVTAANNALAALIGRGPDRALDIARPHLPQPERLGLPNDLPSGLLNRRADLLAARWQVEADSRQIDAAKSRFLPNVSLKALAGVAAQGSANLFAWASRNYQLAPTIDLPIFDAGRLRANLMEQNARYDQSVAHYNKTLIGAISEVIDFFDANLSLRQQATEQQRVTQLAHSSWALAQQRYHRGVGSYLEVLSTQQPLLAAEQEAATLRAQSFDTTVQLIAALGGGLQVPRDTQTDNLPVQHNASFNKLAEASHERR